MAGAGKTSVGKALAEKLNYKFIDTDKVIEDTHKSSLQGLLERYGYLKLREIEEKEVLGLSIDCLLYTSPSPRDVEESRMPSSA